MKRLTKDKLIGYAEDVIADLTKEEIISCTVNIYSSAILVNRLLILKGELIDFSNKKRILSYSFNFKRDNCEEICKYLLEISLRDIIVIGDKYLIRIVKTQHEITNKYLMKLYNIE